MNIRAVCLFALSIYVLVGCDVPANTGKTIIERDEPGPSYYVHDVRLRDGTRCVVSTSGHSQGGTGIACDWNSRGNPE